MFLSLVEVSYVLVIMALAGFHPKLWLFGKYG